MSAWQRWYRIRLNVVVYGLAISVAVLTSFVMPGLIDRLLGGHSPWNTLAGFVIFLIVLYAALSLLQKFRFAPCVYAELRSRGLDVCPKCGYWLRGLSADQEKCPECGARRSPPTSPGED